jgi:hypothetical protein
MDPGIEAPDGKPGRISGLKGNEPSADAGMARQRI